MKKFKTTAPKTSVHGTRESSEMDKIYEHIGEALKEFNRTHDFVKLGKYIKSGEYQNYRKMHPKIVRTGPLTDSDFEEILETVRARNWERFHELLDWEHAEEIFERLEETEEWWEADQEESEQLFELNLPKIQHCTPAQQAAIKEFFLNRDTREAAEIAQMDPAEFHQFLKKLDLKWH
jgi:hypothetical protein